MKKQFEFDDDELGTFIFEIDENGEINQKDLQAYEFAIKDIKKTIEPSTSTEPHSEKCFKRHIHLAKDVETF